METQLCLAEHNFQRVLELIGEPIQPMACEAMLGLARLHYEWNDLNKAEHYGEEAVRLGEQIDGIDTALAGQVVLARVILAKGDSTGAMRLLADLAQTARQKQFVVQIPTIAALQVQIALQQGDLENATARLGNLDLPLSRVRIELAQGSTQAALDMLRAYHQQMTVKAWQDKVLMTSVLQALAYHQHGDLEAAISALEDALKRGEADDYVRTFVDEGRPMQLLLAEAATRGMMPAYTRKILSVFGSNLSPKSQPLIEPLSERELEILVLVADGLSNREISERLYVALSTVKGHNRNIFDKLQVKRRTEAVARARELGLIE